MPPGATADSKVSDPKASVKGTFLTAKFALSLGTISSAGSIANVAEPVLSELASAVTM